MLILGGGGMVGRQVAREAAREIGPSEVIISALTREEVESAVDDLRREAEAAGWQTKFTAAWGDIFLPRALQNQPRSALVRERALFDLLFDEIFSSDQQAYKDSELYHLVEEHKPDLIVDCINTATAISYQDVYTTSKKVKLLLDRLEDEKGIAPGSLQDFVESIRELLIAQGIPQITRHIMFLSQTLRDTAVRLYVKVGTTGTGGMGINIPYTHSEDRPSATLLSKSAIGFAHTGLLFLLARTPGAVSPSGDELHAPIVKEVKPGAMIGFKQLGVTHVRLSGATGRREPGYLLEPHCSKLDGAVQPRESFDDYERFGGKDVPVRLVGADTGENGFFSIGEFQAITYPLQMEFVTPEEVARTVVLEMLGASTGRDVLAAIDGAITEPSYRAGILRDHACRQLDRLDKAIRSEDEDVLPSIAVGHLGPPRLSKLLIEAYLIRAAAKTSSFDDLLELDAETVRTKVEEFLAANPRVTSMIATIGIPILRQNGEGTLLTRGPRLNIPVPAPDGKPIPVDDAVLERFASLGWLDLRTKNFEAWRERMQRMVTSHADIVKLGSAAFDKTKYLPQDFIPGDAVGWLFNSEADDLGMVGHRLF